ncbi:hypothetical protein M9H77_28568 [Catharanthus roseus]|uniref:Uncharacterized protein n=1 Tax=Catharanthus roseus TaxID=4058 RepID=A0ACC0AHD1_CATRO|nr:hypothetical protein M9H77_28568 [Catharanthus roseus]
MFDRYPNLNPPIRQHSTTELQTEIRSLKAQVKELKERVFSVETKNLELDTQLALLQSRTFKGKEVLSDSSIPDFPLAEIPMPEAVLQFIQNRHLIQRSIQQLSKGASSSAQLTVPATPSPLKPDSSTSKITTIATDDNDDTAQFQEFLRFKAFQQQLKQQSTHSPTSSQDSSTEPLGTDPFGGQDPFDF